jgi:general secretion pathway protein I
MIRSSQQPRSNSRSGLTILEVILAIGIFLASATIITQLLGTGTRAAVEGRLKSEMILLAESKMAEFSSGVRELSPISSQSFDDEGIEVDEGFTWSAEIDEGGQGDLLSLTIQVEHTNAQDEVDLNFSITRLMRDPQIWLDAQAEAEEEE